MKSQSKSLPFQHNFFHEIRTAPNVETSEAFPARETNPADFGKLETYSPKYPKPTRSQAKVASHAGVFRGARFSSLELP